MVAQKSDDQELDKRSREESPEYGFEMGKKSRTVIKMVAGKQSVGGLGNRAGSAARASTVHFG